MDYDRVADGYDCRYAIHAYGGVARHLAEFVAGAGGRGVLEMGCGAGHWLAFLANKTPRVVGIDPSRQMLARAAIVAPSAAIVRALAERLPWQGAAFDRVFCINALHHFADRAAAIVESRRVLHPGGALLAAGRIPPADDDRWWVYEYFEETRSNDRARHAPQDTVLRELMAAGFVDCEMFEIDRLDATFPAGPALVNGTVDRRFTSLLTALSDRAFARGVERIRAAMADASARGEELMLETAIRYGAVVGRVPE